MDTEPPNERCLRLLDWILAIVPTSGDEDTYDLRAKLDTVRRDAAWFPPWSSVPAERAAQVLADELGSRRDGWRGQIHKMWITGEAG